MSTQTEIQTSAAVDEFIERLGILERTGRAGDRQDYFRLAEAPYCRLLEGVAERMTRGRAAADAARNRIPSDWIGARERLSELAGFYAEAGENMRQAVDAMRHDGRRPGRDGN